MLRFKSAAVCFPSSVAPGGHIFPLLFSLFVNRITKAVTSCDFFMFAGDLKLLRNVKSESDRVSLQMSWIPLAYG